MIMLSKLECTTPGGTCQLFFLKMIQQWNELSGLQVCSETGDLFYSAP